MANVTVTNPTLVDTCNFPSIRFGRYYTSQLAGDILTDVSDGVDVVHPDPSTYSVTETDAGGEVANDIVYGLPSVESITDDTVTADAGSDKVNVNPTYTDAGATVTSTFGGIASMAHVVEAADGYVVVGKLCEV